MQETNTLRTQALGTIPQMRNWRSIVDCVIPCLPLQKSFDGKTPRSGLWQRATVRRRAARSSESSSSAAL